MEQKIIILSGKSQSGKDTACDFIMDRLNSYPTMDMNPPIEFSSRKYSFATPLKQFCVDVLGLLPHQVFGTNEQKSELTHLCWYDFFKILSDRLVVEISKEFGSPKWEEKMTGRQVLQVFGSDILRNIWGDCWANATINAILADGVPYAFVADARFANEIVKINQLETWSCIIRLERNPLHLSHKSEIILDNFDWSSLKNFIRIDNRNLSKSQKDQILENEVLPYILNAGKT